MTIADLIVRAATGDRACVELIADAVWDYVREQTHALPDAASGRKELDNMVVARGLAVPISPGEGPATTPPRRLADLLTDPGGYAPPGVGESVPSAPEKT